MSEIMVILSAALWGISGIFVNTLTALGFERAEITFFRSLCTAIFGLILLWINRKEQKKVRMKDWWIFFGAGVLGFLGLNLCYLKSIQEIGLSLAAVLLYTSPIFVMIFAVILFHESFTKEKALALVCAVGGCVLVTGIAGGAAIAPMGIAIGVGAGLCYSLYTIFGQIGVRRYDPITVTVWAFIMATVFSAPLVDFGHLVSQISVVPKGLFLLILSGILTSLLPYVFYTLALGRMDAGRAAIIACVEPVVAALAGVLLYHEQLSVQFVIGIGLVLSAVVILNVGLKSKQKRIKDTTSVESYTNQRKEDLWEN